MAFDFSQLGNFTGSQEWFRHSLNRSVLFTEGAKYVADEAKAYWLLDEIALTQMLPAVAKEEFQVWVLEVANNRGLLTCDDGNENIVYSKLIEFTDFPQPGIKFYVECDHENKVILLPSEH
jgi:hypothetical protein